MFWSKKQSKISWPLIMFGILALLIIIFGAILIIKLLDQGIRPMHNKIGNNFVGDQSTGKSEPVYYTPQELKENYNKAILALQQKLTDPKLDLNNFLNEVSEELLQVRVPENMRDRHLQVVLAVGKLQGQLSSLQSEDIKEKLVNLFSGLEEK